MMDDHLFGDEELVYLVGGNAIRGHPRSFVNMFEWETCGFYN